MVFGNSPIKVDVKNDTGEVVLAEPERMKFAMKRARMFPGGWPAEVYCVVFHHHGEVAPIQ